MPDLILRNPIIAALIDDHLNGRIVDFEADADAVQGLLDLVRSQIAANGAIRADAAAQLAEARRRLTEALFCAAARSAPPEESEEQQKMRHPPAAAVPEQEPETEEPDEEELEEAVAELAAHFADVAARVVHALQEHQEVEVEMLLQVEDPEVGARAADYLEMAIRAERILQNERMLVEAYVLLVVNRALIFASTRAHLLPGVLLTVAAAYALAYAVSGGAVVPGFASLLRIFVLVLCFLFGVPLVGNLA